MPALRVNSPVVTKRHVPRLPHPSWSDLPRSGIPRVRTAEEFWSRLGL